MSAITVRTAPKASNQTPRTSASTKPVDPFSEALATFRKDIERFDTVDCESSREALARLVSATNATGADVAAAEKAVADATEALKGFKSDRDALVTRQRRAIRAALVAGFAGKDIAPAFGVSVGNVSGVKAGLDLRAALLKGGMETKQLPSPDSLVSRAVKAGKAGKDAKAALIRHARTTGTLPEDGDVQTFTAAQTLSAVQRAVDAVRHIVRAEGDDDTYAAIVAAVTTLTTLA